MALDEERIDTMALDEAAECVAMRVIRAAQRCCAGNDDYDTLRLFNIDSGILGAERRGFDDSSMRFAKAYVRVEETAHFLSRAGASAPLDLAHVPLGNGVQAAVAVAIASAPIACWSRMHRAKRCRAFAGLRHGHRLRLRLRDDGDDIFVPGGAKGDHDLAWRGASAACGCSM